MNPRKFALANVLQGRHAQLALKQAVQRALADTGLCCQVFTVEFLFEIALDVIEYALKTGTG